MKAGFNPRRNDAGIWMLGCFGTSEVAFEWWLLPLISRVTARVPAVCYQSCMADKPSAHVVALSKCGDKMLTLHRVCVWWYRGPD